MYVQEQRQTLKVTRVTVALICKFKIDLIFIISIVKPFFKANCKFWFSASRRPNVIRCWQYIESRLQIMPISLFEFRNSPLQWSSESYSKNFIRKLLEMFFSLAHRVLLQNCKIRISVSRRRKIAIFGYVIDECMCKSTVILRKWPESRLHWYANS